MKELGEYLKDTRQKHGVSIEEAAEDLEIDKQELENIEGGNTRAFKDVYILKELVRTYAKYLGLDPAKVLDEFNDFLFEHTSKISLDDIIEAKKKNLEKEKEEKKKIISPYTKKPKPKKNWGPVVLVTLSIILFVLILYLVFLYIGREENRTTELRSWGRRGEETYEHTQ